MKAVSGATGRREDYLHRARITLRVLSRSGLGDLAWIGPTWLCALGEVDRRALGFLSARIRQDSRLRRDLRQCRSRDHLRLLQETAIRHALEEYSSVTGRRRASLPQSDPEALVPDRRN
jgi:hypothetical protein